MEFIYKRLFATSHQLSTKVQRTAGGLILLVAILAIIFANVSSSYIEFWDNGIGISHLSRIDFVNEVLMSIFFFAAGLEIRHEFTHGHLRTKEQRRLPFICALGGMLIPMLFMFIWAIATHFFSSTDASTIFHSLPVPVATDAVFALALLSFFSSKIPSEIRIFVLAFVVIDDIGGLAMLSILDGKLSPTIIAVILGFILPEKIHKYKIRRKLLTHLTLVVNFMILPLFALANAGVSLSGLTITSIISAPLFWALLTSQTIGKILGVYYTAMISVKKKWTVLPRNCNNQHMLISAAIAGIGFTLSLYLVNVALRENAEMLIIGKVAIIFATVLAGLVASILTYKAKDLSKEVQDSV